MRIVGGKHANRDLTSPGGNVRPTPEAVRVYALEMIENEVEGARIVDLFAGTGALGLEALSRGAKSVDFVENGSGALHSLKANVAALRVRDQTRIFKRDVIPWIQAVEEGTYDIAFIDAPYSSRKLDRVLERWRAVPFAPLLVIEHERTHDLGVKAQHHDFEGLTRLSIVRARVG